MSSMLIATARQAGGTAYFRGVSRACNPHASPVIRKAWFDGYDFARRLSERGQ